MVSLGAVSTLCTSVTCGLVIAGMVLNSDPVMWLGAVGLVLSTLGLRVSVKNDEKSQELDRLRNPKVWTDDAWYVPSWIMWAYWALIITAGIVATVLLNRLAELLYQ